MKKVIITGGVCCNPFWLSALVGDVIEVDAKIADKLIAIGRAELVGVVEVETAKEAVIETAAINVEKVEKAIKATTKKSKYVIPTNSEGAE